MSLFSVSEESHSYYMLVYTCQTISLNTGSYTSNFTNIYIRVMTISAELFVFLF